jgi:tyrosine-protein kinase Etk/Wzc
LKGKNFDNDFGPLEAEPGDQEQEGRFPEWLALIQRGKWLMLATTLCGLGAAFWYTSTQHPVYEAASFVLINEKSSQAANPFSEMLGGTPDSKLANELAILRSRTLAEAVAAAILKYPYQDTTQKQLYPIVQTYKGDMPTGELAPQPVVAKRAQVAMDFIPQRESDVIKILGYSNFADEAAMLANVYTEAYQEYTMLQSRSRSRSVREFLDKRLVEQRDSLHKAEGELRAFMEASGVVSLDQESQRLVTELAQLQATRNAVDLDIQTSQKKLVSLQNELPQQEAQAAAAIGQASDSYIRELQMRVGQLEAQRDIMVAQNDPAVLAQPMNKQRLEELNGQIESLRARLRDRSAAFIQSFLAGEWAGPQSDALGYLGTLKQQAIETRFQLETLAARRNALDNTIAQYELRFRQIPRQSIEFARLERDRLSGERLYSLVDERYNQATISEKSEFGYVDIIDRAVVPGRPVSPDLRKNSLLGALAGIGLGLSLLFLSQKADIRARTPEQLRRNGYKCLTEISSMGSEIKELKRDGRLPRDVKRLDSSVWLVFDPLSMLAESYRRLRTTLLRMQIENPIKVVLLTSPSPSEGKTTTACNLAVTLAETNKKVVLLDADIRKPRVHAVFNAVNKPGLTDLVAGRASIDQVIQKGVVEGLDFISSGSAVAQPSRIFSSEQMFALLEMVKQRYDFMIIDAPPALVVNDAAVLAGVVDGVIVVVSSGKTRLAAVNRTRDVLRAARGRLLGVVLNNFDSRKEYGRYYGGIRYGHYGTYHGYNSTENQEKRPKRV